jgi:hypothetical protein
VDKTVVGVLHPGEMGAAVGGCLTQRGLNVLWASAGRGPATAARAEAAGMRDVGTASEMSGRAGVILSVCPPHAALDVARSVAGFRGIYVDANAVSPATAREVAQVVEKGGAEYVDGGIIGTAPSSPGDSRLYLSGPRASEISDLFADTPLAAQVIGKEIGQASAVKMAYAAWTKGHRRPAPRHSSPCPRRKRRAGPDRGVAAVPASPDRPPACGGAVSDGERLALGSRNGRNRRHHVRRRPPARFPPGSRNHLHPRQPRNAPLTTQRALAQNRYRRAAGRAVSRLTGGDNQLSPQARAACVSGKAFSRPDTHVRPGISPQHEAQLPATH